MQRIQLQPAASFVVENGDHEAEVDFFAMRLWLDELSSGRPVLNEAYFDSFRDRLIQHYPSLHAGEMGYGKLLELHNIVIGLTDELLEAQKKRTTQLAGSLTGTESTPGNGATTSGNPGLAISTDCTQSGSGSLETSPD